MSNKDERPGGPAGASKNCTQHDNGNFNAERGACKPRVVGASLILGPLSRHGRRWVLNTNRGRLLLTTKQLLAGPGCSSFRRKSIDTLNVLPTPISRADWEAVLRRLFAHREGRA